MLFVLQLVLFRLRRHGRLLGKQQLLGLLELRTLGLPGLDTV
jgi:hypothetical protein